MQHGIKISNYCFFYISPFSLIIGISSVCVGEKEPSNQKSSVQNIMTKYSVRLSSLKHPKR